MKLPTQKHECETSLEAAVVFAAMLVMVPVQQRPQVLSVIRAIASPQMRNATEPLESPVAHRPPPYQG